MAVFKSMEAAAGTSVVSTQQTPAPKVVGNYLVPVSWHMSKIYLLTVVVLHLCLCTTYVESI